MQNNRNTSRAIIIIAFIILNALLLFGISQVWHYFNSGASLSTMFHVPSENVLDYYPEVEWNLEKQEGRKLDPYNQQQIQQDYLNAIALRNKAFDQGQAILAKDAFTPVLFERISTMIQSNIQGSLQSEHISLEHHLELELFSDDGSLVIFKDIGSKHVYLANSNSGSLEHYQLQTNRIVMLLQDGHWRIHQWEGLDASTIPETKIVDNTSFLKAQIKGINYYPRSAPWAIFESGYDSSEIKSDMELIKQTGFNTIRVFIDYHSFGKQYVDPEKLTRLNNFMDIAHEYDLKVVLTLFDFYGEYVISDWNNSRAHIKGIVSDIKNHPALLMWDLKNEPDLDYQTRDKEVVQRWLRHMSQYLRELDSNHPITIGWSNAEAAQELLTTVDAVSFHHYQDPETIATAFEILGALTTKPIILQEFGYSTDNGIWNPFSGSEKAQHNYYEKVATLEAADKFHFMSWTLFDFDNVPDKVAGKRPWRKARQSNFGLYKKDGSPKEAAPIMKKLLRHSQ